MILWNLNSHHFALRVMPSQSAFTAASSSTSAGFKSSSRLACYRSSSAATSRVMSADEALHAPMKAAAAGSTPTLGRCSWTCSTAEEAARHGETARSSCSLDQLRGLRRRLSSPSSPPEVEKSTWLNDPKEKWGLTSALVGWTSWKGPGLSCWWMIALGLPTNVFRLGLKLWH